MSSMTKILEAAEDEIKADTDLERPEIFEIVEEIKFRFDHQFPEIFGYRKREGFYEAYSWNARRRGW